jgi:hypothetical protein
MKNILNNKSYTRTPSLNSVNTRTPSLNSVNNATVLLNKATIGFKKTTNLGFINISYKCTKKRSKSRFALASKNGTILLQSGSSHHLVTLILFSNGNYIYNYKLLKYLDSLINQIDLSPYNPGN